MSIATSMPHEENGITVQFPDANYFQFEGCPSYTAINSQGVKEIDFLWWQRASNTLWMVELKGFYHPANPRHVPTDLSNAAIVNQKLEELYAKSVHTLCMIENNRANTGSCHSFPINPATTYKIVHLVSINPLYSLFLTGLHDKLNTLLAPYKALYNVDSIAVINYESAVSGGIQLPFVR